MPARSRPPPRKGSRVVLMGAGFIGCIVLEALAARGVELTVVEMEDRMLPRMMDHAGGDMIKRWCESKGVTVLTSTQVSAIEQSDGALKVSFSGGGGIDVDVVVCATGVKPNIGFLDGSGIECAIGVLVDSPSGDQQAGHLCRRRRGAGPELLTGAQEIHAIQPTASEHGRIAAMNMAGQATRYRRQPVHERAQHPWPGVKLVRPVGRCRWWRGSPGGRCRRLQVSEALLQGRCHCRSAGAGLTQHVGVIRGLIQTGTRLGQWKERLMQDPHRVMEAYLVRTQGGSFGY